jgi:hypothetical protein
MSTMMPVASDPPFVTDAVSAAVTPGWTGFGDTEAASMVKLGAADTTVDQRPRTLSAMRRADRPRRRVRRCLVMVHDLDWGQSSGGGRWLAVEPSATGQLERLPAAGRGS